MLCSHWILIFEGYVGKNLISLYLYLNYASEHQDPISLYGEESKKQLQAVRMKYDLD